MAAEVIGHYLNPPENAIGISVEEKTSAKNLEKAKNGYVR
jgi:hypothetical protein